LAIGDRLRDWRSARPHGLGASAERALSGLQSAPRTRRTGIASRA
jgi:hypothetical protein